MKYTFNNTNIITGYIKELLHEFNLPIYTVYREDKPVYDGKFYIKDDYIVQAIYNRDSSGKVIYIDGKPSVRFITIDYYKIGKDLGSCTTNLKIQSASYDNLTHYHLGNYLRFLRDYKKLDLMSLYNCFGYESPRGLNYTISTPGNKTFKINTYDSDYRYYIIPAKFNEKYTIAMDLPYPIEVCGIIYTGDQVLNVSKELSKITYKKLSVSMLNPAIFSLDIDAGQMVRLDDTATTAAPFYDYEKYLRILIKIPSSAAVTTITILEGEYTNNYILGNKCTTYIQTDEGKLCSAPTYQSLMRLNDGISYPFADRLVEYLIGNTIDNIHYVKNNVSRLQEGVYKSLTFRGEWDIWSDKLRDDIYTIEKKNIKPVFFDTLVKKEIKSESSESSEITETWEDYNYKDMRFIDVNPDLLSYGDKDVELLVSRS